jgi:signal transduction histidine kinase
VQRRLTVSILLLVVGTLALAAIGSYFLVRRTAATTAEQQLYQGARLIADNPTLLLQKTPPCCTRLELVGGYQSLGVAGLNSDGTFSDLPATLTGVGSASAQTVGNGTAVRGTSGSLVYVLIPLTLSDAQKLRLRPPLLPDQQAVLVATRATDPVVSGWAWFVLIGAACLAVAAAVASWLARRFSRPVYAAVGATRRIAAGDLDARLEVTKGDGPQLAALASSLNAMAAELSRARDQQRQFLLSVSHELRTPLTSIIGYADALRDGAIDDVERALDVITTEAHRLERLVGDLLELGSLGAKRFSLHPTILEATEVVHEAVEAARQSVAGTGLLIEADVASISLVVQADADRLRQVLGNLIDNASHFARARIVVSAYAEAGAVILCVLDDGPGIAPGDLGHVFEPHFTSDRSGQRRRGSGLGLAIVAELVAAMGGTVRAESPVGAQGGTRMVVRLPSVASAPALEAAPRG